MGKAMHDTPALQAIITLDKSSSKKRMQIVHTALIHGNGNTAIIYFKQSFISNYGEATPI
ncbi:hypothetical protein [Parasediminibacterium sp. JCM 36343]|uniref:hypothetical protein n=1 Tax=Parasediminibacterium sp. JCM 36343 TaxID=3374279 RepID=UPI00397CEBB4